MTDASLLSGYANPPFEGVGEAFARNFAEDLELGAGFSVFVDGAPAVNLHGGYADRARACAWSDETIAGIFSSGKAALALLVAREVSKGRIGYDMPVAAYWPDFAASGKETISVAEVMSHQAGLCGIAEEMAPETWLDWEAICRRIEREAPLWPPGSANGYSPQLFGFIVGEILRRTTGRRVSEILREDFAEAQGLAIICGLGAPERARAATMKKPPAPPDLGKITPLKEIAFLKPWSAPARVSHEDWMAAEIPASNMHASAPALAAIVHPFANRGLGVDGAKILSPDAIEETLAERITGDDLVLPFRLSWCAGLMRNINHHFGPSPTAFGHAGFGGSCVMLDPAHRLSAAYVMNRMSPHLVGDPRAVRLLDAVYEVL